MSRLTTALILAATLFTASRLAAAATGDAARGEQLLSALSCPGCHGPNRPDLKVTDLSQRISRNYTPAFLASVLWNHGLFQPSILRAGLNETQTADLFAYFASRRFFEPLGDSYRGRAVFRTKCETCHGLTQKTSADSSPVTDWASLGDPIAFSQEMWNRTPAAMGDSYTRKGLRHPRLTSQEMNDLLIYLEHVPSVPQKPPSFRFATGDTGPGLFAAKGCATCHKGKMSFEYETTRSNMAGVAAAMWNHSIDPKQVREALTYGEMSSLVSYVWSLESLGHFKKGESVFARKSCGACHDSKELSAAMAMSHREILPFSLLTAMTNYGSKVNSEIAQKGVAWPKLSPAEMTNLVEFLSAPCGPKLAGRNCIGKPAEE